MLTLLTQRLQLWIDIFRRRCLGLQDMSDSGPSDINSRRGVELAIRKRAQPMECKCFSTLRTKGIFWSCREVAIDWSRIAFSWCALQMWNLLSLMHWQLAGVGDRSSRIGRRYLSKNCWLRVQRCWRMLPCLLS